MVVLESLENCSTQRSFKVPPARLLVVRLIRKWRNLGYFSPDSLLVTVDAIGLIPKRKRKQPSMGDLPCFRMKPSDSGAEVLDIVATQEVLEKLSRLAPVVIVGVQSHAMVHGAQSESGMVSLRLEVIPTEMVSDMSRITKEAENVEGPEVFINADPALDRLQRSGFIG